MKFEVKVGASFEVGIRNERTLAAKAKKPASSRSLKEIASVALIVLVSGVLLGTVIYGVFTGDFSVTESVWNAINAYIPGLLKN